MRWIGLALLLAACVGQDEQEWQLQGVTLGTGEPAAVHLVGRFDVSDPEAPRFAWPGSSIVTRFTGSEISIRLFDSGLNQFEVWVDAVPGPVLKAQRGDHVYPLATGLAEGEHEVVVTRRTESFMGATRFLGFPGAASIPTTPPARMIELIGDSISCGYGILGSGARCDFSRDTEAETHAWGALAASELGAVHTTLAYSGLGVFRNYGNSAAPTMPVLFDRTIADDPTSVWDFRFQPDVVVIALGTNDFIDGDPGPDFARVYAEFLATVRGRYPEAWIILAGSPMLKSPRRDVLDRTLEELRASRSAGGDERVAVLHLDKQAREDGYGCDWHPSLATHRKMASALAALVRQLTGW